MRLKVDINRQAFPRIRTCVDALRVTHDDLRGPALTRLSQVHRRQEKRIFASEGAEGGSGRWPALSPEYAARKRSALRRGRVGGLRRRVRAPSGALTFRAIPARREGPISMKILVWSGDMRERFQTTSRPENIERYVTTGAAVGRFEFGAQSKIAGYHFAGEPPLPKRDMVTKSAFQVAELREAFARWYLKERLPQVSAFCRKQAAAASRALAAVTR